MSWASLDPHHQQQLERVLTKTQLHVLVLHLGGFGTRRIMRATGLSRTRVRELVEIGSTAMAQLDRKDAA